MPARYSRGVNSAAIELRDVSVSRGGRQVLRNVTLTVAPGETLALVGRSGVGKSTVLKLINRMLEPDAGDVFVAGRLVREWDVYDLRRHLGYVLQEVALFPHMSVAENVAVVPRLAGHDAASIALRVRELLQLTGLAPEEYADRRPHQLSGGQRQRVGVARALAADPPILLMDEPFGALDPITRSEIHGEFRKIQARLQKTVVIVTHDMAEALALATRVGVLAEGELVALAPPGRITSMDEPRVRALLQPLAEATAAFVRRPS
jgi:osmoprotectant transport system ATP-binding protein